MCGEINLDKNIFSAGPFVYKNPFNCTSWLHAEKCMSKGNESVKKIWINFHALMQLNCAQVNHGLLIKSASVMGKKEDTHRNWHRHFICVCLSHYNLCASARVLYFSLFANKLDFGGWDFTFGLSISIESHTKLHGEWFI